MIIAAAAFLPVSGPGVSSALSGPAAVALAPSAAQSHPFFTELLLRSEVAVVESFQTPPFYLDAQFAFDVADHVTVFGPGQGERLTGLFGAAGPSDAVGIGVGGVWEVKVDNVGDFGDIDAVGGDVSGHQDVELAGAEPVHRLLPGVLRHIALEGRHPERILGQFHSQGAGAVLGAREDQGPTGGSLLQKRQQQVPLFFVWDRVQGVRHGLGRCDHPDLDHLWVLEDLYRQCPDLGGHGCREEKGLPFGWDVVEDTADIGHEPHVAHGVGFVQDQDLDAGKVDVFLADMVQQAAGTGHHYLGPAP